jgi:hypothetical protein
MFYVASFILMVVVIPAVVMSGIEKGRGQFITLGVTVVIAGVWEYAFFELFPPSNILVATVVTIVFIELGVLHFKIMRKKL